MEIDKDKSSSNNNDWGTAQGDRRFEPRALHITKENKSIYLIAVSTLAIVAITSLCGIITLAYFSKEIPQAVIALGSAAIGAIGGLLTFSK